MKPAIFVLVVACLALSAGLVVVKQQGDKRVKDVEASSARAVVELDEVKAKFTDLEKLYAVQQNTLSMRNEELALASNGLAKANSELTSLSENLKTAQAELTKSQDRIAALETEREDLNKKMEDLTASINKLELQITETKSKLAAAEGDKTFLLSELNRLQTEKDALVRQFNNLAALRAQVAKLKEEAAIKQRLEWKRLGVYAMQGQKGAERLMAKTFVPAGPENRLGVEFYQDGTPRLVPTATNAPAGGTGP